MKYDDLAARRAAAIAKDSCFTKGRLRDEFRMKPAPGTEPVKWYKSPYGGKYGVYRITDCVPMREKRQQTDKQRLSSLRLSILSQLNSTCGRLAHKAHTWLGQNPLFLDTETTGLGDKAEALEIGLTDVSGSVVFETRLKPTVAIEPQAAAVHGIDESALNGAHSWPDVAQQLRHAIGQRPLIIFNAPFDTRILKQTAAAHGDPADWLDDVTVHCAMKLAADYFGATNRYGTISLASASSQAALVWEGQAHSAIADAKMTAGVVCAIAAYFRQLQQELESLESA
ncbi:3'-5' exonuclease [Photorhabdus africana]|uniref:3'-5' exonuclease n=1 Tax=Photorhabdus africana TaxID=3097554 RepID=UPI002B4157BB|nr:3'-5' exonuclease [Photorhabdus sp. CRI-LC]